LGLGGAGWGNEGAERRTVRRSAGVARE
jgi:hypothetical protein